MADYRTPDEEHAKAAKEARIGDVLEQAVQNGASLFAAMTLEESPEVVELWVDRLWDGLRDNLDDEDRLVAITMLLHDRMDAEMRAVLRSVRGVGR